MTIYRNLVDSAQAIILAMRKIGVDCETPSNRVSREFHGRGRARSNGGGQGCGELADLPLFYSSMLTYILAQLRQNHRLPYLLRPRLQKRVHFRLGNRRLHLPIVARSCDTKSHGP